jgi:hypothetical protein
MPSPEPNGSKEPRVVLTSKMIAFIYGAVILLYFVGDKVFHGVLYLVQKEIAAAAVQESLKTLSGSDTAQTKLLSNMDQAMQIARRDLDAQRIDFENEKKLTWNMFQEVKGRLDRMGERTTEVKPKPQQPADPMP